MPTNGPDLVVAVLDEVVRHPGRAVAMAHRAVTAGSESDWGWVALSFGLSWWGYHHEAYHALPAARPDDPLLGAYYDWARFTAQKRLEGGSNDVSHLRPHLTTLHDYGHHHTATLLEIETVQDAYLLSGASDDVTARMAELAVYCRKEGLAHYLGLIVVLDVYKLNGQGQDTRAKVDDLHALAEEAASDYLTYYYHVMMAAIEGERISPQVAYSASFRALQVAEAIGFGSQVGYLHLDLSRHLGAMGRYDEARPHVERAFERAERLNHIFLQSTAGQQMADVYLVQGLYDEAEAILLQTEDYFEALEADYLTAWSLYQRGLLAQRRGDFARAFHLFEGAEGKLEATSFGKLTRLQVMIALGRLLYHMGRQSDAQQYIEEAMFFANDHDFEQWTVKPVIMLASVMSDHDLNEALETVEIAYQRAANHDMQPEMHLAQLVQAEIYLKQGQYQRALGGFSGLTDVEAESIYPYGQHAQLGMAESLLALDRTAEAAEVLDTYPPETAIWQLDWYHDWLHARLNQETGDIAAALEWYDRALDALVTVRQNSRHEHDASVFADRHSTLYEDAFACALENGELEWALRFNERRAAQFFAQFVDVQPLGDTDQPLSQRLQRIMTLRYGPEWTLVRYAYHRETFYAFVLTPEADLTLTALENVDPSDVVFLTPPPQASEEDIREYVYTNISQRTTAEALSNLYTTLIPNRVKARLTDPDHLLVMVRSERLNPLNFNLLTDAEGDFLIQKCAPSYARSLATLEAQLRKPVHLHKNGVVLGQSKFDEPYGNLESVPLEAADCMKLGWFTQNLVDAPLTAEDLNQRGQNGAWEGVSTMHIGTHTHIDDESWIIDGLLLGGGTITLKDLRRWRLTADLVVIPDCTTGISEWLAGDEITGVAQSILAAGASTVIASQWATGDTCTRLVMARFYAELDKGQPPARALARAQRSVIEDYEAYYWSPYYVLGCP